MTSTVINIVVALNCEAQPLIKKFALSRERGVHYPIYSGVSQDGRGKLNLLVSGVGDANIGVAVGWLASHTKRARCAWLNVGTAGHMNLAQGTVVRVAHCQSNDGKFAHYPPQVVQWQGAIAALLTGDSVINKYPEGRAVDMEGSSFFHAALKFCNAEWVQSLKVISDNSSVDVAELNARKIEEIMSNSIEPIADFVTSLFDSIFEIESVSEPELESLIGHLRCTVNQRLQLLDLLQKRVNLGADPRQLKSLCKEALEAKGLIKTLSREVLTIAPQLGAM